MMSTWNDDGVSTSKEEAALESLLLPVCDCALHVCLNCRTLSGQLPVLSTESDLILNESPRLITPRELLVKLLTLYNGP